MSDRVSELYREMLEELHGELDEVDRLSCCISEQLLGMMAEETPSDRELRRLRELDRRHRLLLVDVATGLSRIYPGRIELAPPSGDFIRSLEQRNRQSEELARIISRLQTENCRPMRECVMGESEISGEIKMENRVFLKGVVSLLCYVQPLEKILPAIE